MTTATLTLSEFLLARLDDYERAIDEVTSTFYDAPMSETEMWADLAAKRRIVELHSGPEFGRPNAHLCYDSVTPDDSCETLRALAAIYAEHPDYREEWRP